MRLESWIEGDFAEYSSDYWNDLEEEKNKEWYIDEPEKIGRLLNFIERTGGMKKTF